MGAINKNLVCSLAFLHERKKKKKIDKTQYTEKEKKEEMEGEVGRWVGCGIY